ncbi:MAG: hypothetical protein IJU91_10375 [Selenomonadaceae bacterium]|nr:hypothetical protein [Selenomonadaceae bacterium]
MLNFIEDELLKDDGLIKLIFPRGMYDQNNRHSYEKATAYFLLNQHYSKLQDIQKDDTVKKCLWTLGLINNAADFDSIKNTAKKTQWRLYADNLLSPCIWAGEEYDPQTEGCVQIGIEVTTYTDFNYKPEHQKKIREATLIHTSSIC